MSCAVPECDGKPRGRGLCNMHYKRLRRHGSPHVTLPRTRAYRGARYPVEALERRLDVYGNKSVAHLCGLHWETVRRERERGGFTDRNADFAAVRCGWLPWQVWPDWDVS